MADCSHTPVMDLRTPFDRLRTRLRYTTLLRVRRSITGVNISLDFSSHSQYSSDLINHEDSPGMINNKFAGFSLQTINQRDLLLIGIALGVSLFITLNMGEKSYDDAYITYRYAKNLISGQGFVYNS